MLVVTAELQVKRTPDEVVRELMRILGTPFVAILAGVPSTRTVRLWSEGTQPPEELDLLRFALQVAEVLLEREDIDVVRAWFGGLNPDLDDENPLLLLAGGTDAQRQSVLDAARRYISER
jgi:hypothetical protein